MGMHRSPRQLRGSHARGVCSHPARRPHRCGSAARLAGNSGCCRRGGERHTQRDRAPQQQTRWRHDGDHAQPERRPTLQPSARTVAASVPRPTPSPSAGSIRSDSYQKNPAHLANYAHPAASCSGDDGAATMRTTERPRLLRRATRCAGRRSDRACRRPSPQQPLWPWHPPPPFSLDPLCSSDLSSLSNHHTTRSRCRRSSRALLSLLSAPSFEVRRE